MASALAEAHRRPHQPPLVPVVTGQWRLGDVRHIVASPRLAVDVLGFEAQVPFAAGMAELAGAPP
jgi:dTDP-L-rhamnose 4-epimerase